MKKRKPKKVRKARNKEFKAIVSIINSALVRILSRRTTRTYQQELHFIAKSIQELIDASYIPKAIHVKENLEQYFGVVNLLEDEKRKLRKEEADENRIEVLENAIMLIKRSRKWAITKNNLMRFKKQ